MNDSWNKFIKEGDIMYHYMITSFNQMFNNDGTIKNFDMRYGTYSMGECYELIYATHGNQIHDTICLYIHEEYRSGCLFIQSDWKPFRDQIDLTQMYYGYRKLCMYNDYYLQLIMVNELCDTDNNRLEGVISFQVALYGWKNGKDLSLSIDMKMPDHLWKRI